MESFKKPSSRIKEGTNLKINHNYSLIDLIHELVLDPEFKVYYPNKKIDDFEINENQPCEVLGLNWNSDLLNFSLKLKIKGNVKLPIGYDKFGLDENFETFIYRNLSLIKNGKVCLDKINFIAGKDCLETLEKLDLTKYSEKENNFEIFLKNINLLNNSIDKNLELFVRNLINLNKKEALLKVLKESIKEKNSLDIPLEKNEFLKKVGITNNGFFKKIENKEENFIEVTEFKTYLKGISSFPKISEVKSKNKENKILNPRDKMIQEAINECEFSENLKLFEETKKEIQELEKYINSVKISCLKKGEWLDGSSLKNIKTETLFEEYCLVLEVSNKKIKI